ncbi:MAG: integrin alpha [Isosphaeraceae bacterium]
MLFGKRAPRSTDSRSRGAFRPSGDALERRDLLALTTIDLGGVPPGTGSDTLSSTTPRTTPLPAITGDKLSPSPGQSYGIDQAGTLPGGSAGFSVSDVGDVNGDGFEDFVVGAPSVTTPGGTPTSTTPTVYLIFGSKTTNAGAISDWLTINQNFNGGETQPVGTGRVGTSRSSATACRSRRTRTTAWASGRPGHATTTRSPG